MYATSLSLYDYWFWYDMRMAVLDRDKSCLYCARTLTPLTVTIDHYKPRSRGGSDEFYNLRAACRRCNERKGNTEPIVYVNSLEPIRIKHEGEGVG